MEAIAKLNRCPYSPRKMRLLADIIRGKSVEEALTIVKFHPKKPYGIKLEKLILSAVSNYQQKNDESKVDENRLYIKTIMVDEGKMLKRIQPAPQGRAHRIRKRSNHVTLIVDDIENKKKKKIEKPVTIENIAE